MQREIQNQESVLEDDDTNETEEILKEVQEDGDKDETPEESARAALKELQKESSDGDSSESDGETAVANASSTKEQGVVDNQTSKQQNPNQVILDVEPPQRLSVAEKEIFNKLPKKFKPAVARMFKEHQAAFTQTQQQLNREISETRGIREAVQPFAADFAERGFTIGAGLAALCAAQQKLTNPKTSHAAYVQLGKDLGIDFEKLGIDPETTEHASSDISSHPQIRALQTQVNTLISEREHFLRSQDQEATGQIVSEFETVQNEIDPITRRYKYPELHDEGFLRSTEPLVSAYVGAIPGITYAQALKKAWADLKGIPHQDSNAANQTRLVAASNQNRNRAVSAAVSVRGRSSQTLNPNKTETAVARNETPEQSARIALEELLRGN